MATIAQVRKATLEGAVLLIDGVERCRVEATMIDQDGQRAVKAAVQKWTRWYPDARCVQIIG